jgi:hypothetical protein
MMNDDLFLNEDRKYSLNRIIRLMSGFPEDKPLPCRYEHGHSPFDDKPVNDLKSKKRLMLVYNKRRLETWQRYSKKPAFIIGSPFVQYRRLQNICKAEDACGTVVFPMHSTPKEEGVFDRQEYCRQLKELPAEFHPLKLCLHEHDFVLGFDKVYREQGFEVVTAGVRETPDFVDKFYEILRRCRYATSNAFGSYVFYAVEMGIPFFIYGPSTSIRYTDKKHSYERVKQEGEFGTFIEDLFSTYPEVEITEEQRIVVEREVGIKDAIGREALYSLLLENYWRQRVEDVVRFPFRHPKKFARRMFTGIPLLDRLRS